MKFQLNSIHFMSAIKYLALAALMSLTVSISNTRSEFDRIFEEDEFLGGKTDYEMYLYVVSWPQTFCIKNDYSYCSNKLKGLKKKNIFRIHGLWPNMKNGPTNDCNEDKDLPVNFESPIEIVMKERLNELWPSLKGSNNKFWVHEYNKHGLCYEEKIGKQGIYHYFSEALSLYDSLKIATLAEKVLNPASGKTEEYTYESLVTAFSTHLGGIYYELTCEHKDNVQYFNDIRIYLDLNFNGMIKNKLNTTNCNKSKNLVVAYEN